jgi:hypothetical protein
MGASQHQGLCRTSSAGDLAAVAGHRPVGGLGGDRFPAADRPRPALLARRHQRTGAHGRPPHTVVHDRRRADAGRRGRRHHRQPFSSLPPHGRRGRRDRGKGPDRAAAEPARGFAERLHHGVFARCRRKCGPRGPGDPSRRDAGQCRGRTAAPARLRAANADGRGGRLGDIGKLQRANCRRAVCP